MLGPHTHPPSIVDDGRSRSPKKRSVAVTVSTSSLTLTAFNLNPPRGVQYRAKAAWKVKANGNRSKDKRNGSSCVLCFFCCFLLGGCAAPDCQVSSFNIYKGELGLSSLPLAPAHTPAPPVNPTIQFSCSSPGAFRLHRSRGSRRNELKSKKKPYTHIKISLSLLHHHPSSQKPRHTTGIRLFSRGGFHSPHGMQRIDRLPHKSKPQTAPFPSRSPSAPVATAAPPVTPAAAAARSALRRRRSSRRCRRASFFRRLSCRARKTMMAPASAMSAPMGRPAAEAPVYMCGGGCVWVRMWGKGRREWGAESVDIERDGEVGDS